MQNEAKVTSQGNFFQKNLSKMEIEYRLIDKNNYQFVVNNLCSLTLQTYHRSLVYFSRLVFNLAKESSLILKYNSSKTSVGNRRKSGLINRTR